MNKYNISMLVFIKIRRCINKKKCLKKNKKINFVKKCYNKYAKKYNLYNYNYLLNNKYITINNNISYVPNDFVSLSYSCNNAIAGDIITLQDNTTYYGNLKIENINGEDENLIYILGNNTSSIYGNNLNLSKVLQITNSSYVFFGLETTIIDEYGKGFSLTNAQKGFYANNCNNLTIQNLNIYNIGEEGLHIMNNSYSVNIYNNKIYNTGLYIADYGEGIYVGSAETNWIDDEIDATNNIDISYNYIYDTIAECIDIKEGTFDGLIQYNYMNGSKLNNNNDADSWIDVKGSFWIIQNNTMEITYTDGIQVHYVDNQSDKTNSGSYNTFKNNNMNCITNNDVSCSGYAINISNKTTGNIVCNNNIYENADKGLTNVTSVDC